VNLLFSLTTASPEEQKLSGLCVEVEDNLNSLLKEHATIYQYALSNLTSYRMALLQLPEDYHMLSLCSRWSDVLSKLIHENQPDVFIEAW